MDSQVDHIIRQGKIHFILKSIRKDTPVAIKKAHDLPGALKILENEISIHRQLDHPNIVAFLQDLYESPDDGLVMELIQDGDLFDFLSKRTTPVPLSSRLSISLDVARGVDYLHGIKIIHRDIKCENVLLEYHNNTIKAKLCDFGMSAFWENATFKLLTGTQTYLAPELFSSIPLPYSPKSDIFALAILLWMMASLRNTSTVTMSLTQLGDHLKNGHRENIPDKTEPEYANLISLCWAQSPHDRPDSSSIINTLIQMKEKNPGSAIINEKSITQRQLSSSQDCFFSNKKQKLAIEMTDSPDTPSTVFNTTASKL